ncbi:hypothetical protein [Chamaesiphon sp. GL140_3_metabinner_50]|uniref:hypothetical protein n=1 Tax=Chamaesiphon sp. GL140_3_metabinner_50 TaxID=2970812 RepID=UPI0025D6B963|nr:hypothetical protein [Chamaesiphon sp. GL140_3_metabinner_50]
MGDFPAETLRERSRVELMTRFVGAASPVAIHTGGIRTGTADREHPATSRGYFLL